MPTPNQEKTYNEFMKFYDLAQDLIQTAEDSIQDYSSKQFEEIEEEVLYLEESTDKLTENYIDIVKNSSDQQKIEEVRKILNNIQNKTRQCREKLIKIYESSN